MSRQRSPLEALATADLLRARPMSARVGRCEPRAQACNERRAPSGQRHRRAVGVVSSAAVWTRRTPRGMGWAVEGGVGGRTAPARGARRQLALPPGLRPARPAAVRLRLRAAGPRGKAVIDTADILSITGKITSPQRCFAGKLRRADRRVYRRYHRQLHDGGLYIRDRQRWGPWRRALACGRSCLCRSPRRGDTRHVRHRAPNPVHRADAPVTWTSNPTSCPAGRRGLRHRPQSRLCAPWAASQLCTIYGLLLTWTTRPPR